MKDAISVKSFGVALAIILMLVVVGGCERKIIPGNPFDEYDQDEENYSTCYDDEELEICFTGDNSSVVTIDMLAENGTTYTIEAIEGQVCVWFEEGVPYKTAKQSIKASGGRIVAQIPENGYYLADVPADKENVFLNRIKKENFVDRAYPNMVYYPCAVNNYILDNFNPNYSRSDGDTTPHGDIVQYALQEYAEGISLMPYNIGAIDGQYMNNKKYFENGRFCPIFGCTNSEVYAIKDISKKTGSEPIIINMSFGPALPERMINDKEVGYYWNKATDDEKQEYRERYLLFMKETIKNLEPLNGKDFVVVKSAGNSGVKTFDKDIIAYLRDHLSTREKEVMDKHFLLVAAGETERMHQDYSNEMESGHYDPWVTKTDISDFKFEGKKRKGTSFAAPRTAGILSSVANEMNLTASEVLKLAREVTKRDGELTKEALLQTANEIKLAIDNNEVTIEGVLRMYLLDNMGGGSVTYYTDKDGNVITAVDENNSMHPYCQTINEYRETDFDNTYLAFVVETDKAVDVNPYHIEDASFVWEGSLPNQSAFEISLSQELGISEREFASKYANKRVRVSGTLYAVVAGWRHATDVGLNLKEIKLLETVGSHESSDSQNTRAVQSMLSLKGSVWESRNHSSFYTKRTLEFISNESVRITEYQFWTDNKIFELKYFYKKEDNEWRMVVNVAGDQEPFYIKDGILVEYSFAFGRNRPIQEYKRIK